MLSRIPADAWLVIISSVLPLGAGIFYWNISSRPLRILTALLFYNFTNNIALLLLALWGVNNMFLLHVYAPIAYTLLATLFSYWQQKRPALYMRISIPLFIIIYLILLTTGYENLRLPNKNTLSIMSLFTAIITLSTLFYASRTQPTLHIYNDERLWVSVGTFSNYALNVTIFSSIPTYITRQLWLIYSILAIIGNLLYLRAYLCLRK